MTLIFEETENGSPDKLSQIKEISAEGSVLIQREDQVIKSNFANFFPNENKIHMTGDVRIINGGKSGIRSENMIIDLSSGTSNFIGMDRSYLFNDLIVFPVCSFLYVGVQN